MLTFTYTARDPSSGKKVKAQVQADNEAAAAKLIKAEGLAPIVIESAGRSTNSSNPITKFRNRIKTKEKIIFSRQMSTLINAGLPLLQSLRQVAGQTTNKTFEAVIGEIINDVEGGKAFSVALEKHPNVFNSIYVNLIAAGEASGTLDKALERIAFQQEKDAEIISKVRGAMAYPAIVILVMFAVVGFMIVKVLPQVEVIYKGMPGTSLPLVTRILLAVSHFTTKYWWAVLLVLVLAIFMTTKYARTPGGREVIDKFKMTAWPFGPLFMKLYMARFARTANTLVASGVPLIQMLEITGKSINNVHIERSITNAIEKVKGGKALSDSIKDDPNFLDLVPNMIHIGEQSGAIEDMLGKVADYYEKEVDQQIKTISTLIEPLLMVMLGVMAFTVVAAVLLPIYGLAGKDVIK